MLAKGTVAEGIDGILGTEIILHVHSRGTPAIELKKNMDGMSYYLSTGLHTVIIMEDLVGRTSCQ